MSKLSDQTPFFRPLSVSEVFHYVQCMRLVIDHHEEDIELLREHRHECDIQSCRKSTARQIRRNLRHIECLKASLRELAPQVAKQQEMMELMVER